MGGTWRRFWLVYFPYLFCIQQSFFKKDISLESIYVYVFIIVVVVVIAFLLLSFQMEWFMEKIQLYNLISSHHLRDFWLHEYKMSMYNISAVILLFHYVSIFKEEMGHCFFVCFGNSYIEICNSYTIQITNLKCIIQ